MKSTIQSVTHAELETTLRNQQNSRNEISSHGVTLFAIIRESSRYSGQNLTAKNMGMFPFPVHIDDDSRGFVVKGGPGGRYQLSDVDLFTPISNGRLIQLTSEEPSFIGQILSTTAL